MLKKASLWGAFFVFGLLAGPAQALCPAPGALPQVQVKQVVDGDTLRLADGRRIRLVGINAPELSGAGRTPEAFAQASRKRLGQLVADSGGKVGLWLNGKDRYGRSLAHAFDGRGKNLEAQLLAEGLGYFVAFAPATSWRDCQQRAEEAARLARAGLWRSAPLQSPAQIRRAGFAVVQGRITRIEENRGGLWLQFDEPLVARVEPALLEHFDAAALRALKGREVLVRGWVVDRSRNAARARQQARWMLLLSDPAMLQQLP